MKETFFKGLIKGTLIDYIYIITNEQAEDFISLLQETVDNSLFACDTETYPNIEEYGSLAKWNDPHTSKIKLFQIFYEEWICPIILDISRLNKEVAQKVIEELAKDRYRKIFHNAQYDLKIIRNNFGLWMENVWCTKILMQRLGLCTGYKSSKLRKHSYISLASNFFHIDISKTEQKSDWSSPNLSSTQLEYSALDVAAPKTSSIKSILLEGYKRIKYSIEEEYEVKESLEWDIGATLIIARIEYEGMPISTNTLKAVMKEVSSNLERLKVEIAKLLNYSVTQKPEFIDGKVKAKYIVSEEVSRALNNPNKMVDRINQVLYGGSLTNLTKESLKTLLKDLEKKKTDDGEETKVELKSDIEIIQKIIDYKKLLKMNGTDYLAMINPITGCLHSNYQPIGAASGRMSSGKNELEGDSFNAQQLSTVKIIIDEVEDPFESFSKQLIR